MGEKKYFLIVLFCVTVAFAASNRLELAIAQCQVEKVGELLQQGDDPNARDAQGQPILRWLASGRRGCDDSTALATAKLLDEHGAQFQSSPTLLSNIAHRELPKTLAFLAGKKGTGDPTQALKAIARKGDMESVRVLLAAGADPLSGVALTSALFDASAEGKDSFVIEMLKYVKDKQSPKVKAAYEIAKKQGNQKIAQMFLDAGVKPAEPTQQLSCQRQELTLAQIKLLKKLGLPNSEGLFGLAGPMTCKFVQQCGDLILVDCNSAADGPAYYINEKAASKITTCGGACMQGCKGCPPKGWTCECKL